MKRFTLPVILLASTAYASADPSQSGDVGFEIGLSSNGLSIAPTYDFSHIAPGLHARLPLTFGSLSYKDTDDSGNTIEGTFDTDTVGLFADYYPTGGGFRVSAGLVSGGYDLTASVNDITDEAGNTVAGPFSISLSEEDSIAPALTLGFSSTNPQFGGFIDFGARFNALEVSVGGTSGLSSSDQATIDNYINETNEDLSDALGFMPMISFGFRYNL